MSKPPKISFNIDQDLYDAVMDIKRPGPTDNKTYMFTCALHDAVNLEKENQQLRRQLELVQLKILFTLRALAGTRGDEFLKKVDQDFHEKRDTLQHLIMDEGMDYGEI